MTQIQPPAAPERRSRTRQGILRPAWNVLFSLLRVIGRHVQGFHAALGMFLVGGLVMLVAAILAFVGLAKLVAAGKTQQFDETVLLWLNARASPGLDIAALEVTALGATLVVWMVIFIASLFLWLSRHHYSVLLLWVAMLGAGIINSTLKAFYDRPRPDLFPWRAPHAGQSSFPSGHSMTAVAVYATLAYLVVRLESSPRQRWLTFAVTGVVIVLIGLSRMYLGVHYPSDVIGGFVVGLAWATFCAVGIEAIRHFRRRRPGVDAVEKDLDAEEERALGLRQ